MPHQPSQLLLLQQFLSDMRKEQREDHQLLVEKVDSGFQSFSEHAHTHALDNQKMFALLDKRVTPLESTHRSLKWAVRSIVGAFIVFLFDMALNHLPRILTHTMP